jgi:four helix bundle protein
MPREVAIFGKLRILGRSENRNSRNSENLLPLTMIRDVTDLEVYKESLRLLKKLYIFLRKLPRSEYDTVVQSKKCGKSIPANIAEGFAKRASELEFKRFLMIAIGSSDELVTHLRTIAITVPRLINEAKEIAEEYKILSKRLNKLHSNWKSGYF